jgi:uncharacterized protein
LLTKETKGESAMGNPVVHFEIMGSGDANGLQQFYAQLFEWKIDTNNPMDYGIVDTGAGEGSLAGGIGKSSDGSKALTIYVSVPDLQAALDKAESLGGKTLMPPTELGPVAIAQFEDPEGNVVGLTRA